MEPMTHATIRDQDTDERVIPHYPNLWERAADKWVHLSALAVFGLGAAVLVYLAATHGQAGLVVAAAVYGAALIAMLAFSTAYNLSHEGAARPFLRRLDEAGIFLMIAGSYTPFTTQSLHGAWAWSMTILVWTIAAAGIVGKLLFSRISERAWTALYVLFGWVAVIALEPLRRSLPVAAFLLLLAGGLVYTAGSVLFLIRRLPFRRAAWHGMVCVGAALHFSAVLVGVMFASAVTG
ncbi:MAG TPA: hemolysin III family protein [Caulobacteraceae bacterium]|jgi:hemolysin III|nr:hemolysin III family protein [Caulobacteraceae bacterium]